MTLLLRDPYVCKDINERHVNSRYLKVIHSVVPRELHAWFDLALAASTINILAYCLAQDAELNVLGYHMQEYTLPNNVVATTSFVAAIQGAQYAIHAVPVQHSRKFLESIAVSLFFS